MKLIYYVLLKIFTQARNFYLIKTLLPVRHSLLTYRLAKTLPEILLNVYKRRQSRIDQHIVELEGSILRKTCRLLCTNVLSRYASLPALMEALSLVTKFYISSTYSVYMDTVSQMKYGHGFQKTEMDIEIDNTNTRMLVFLFPFLRTLSDICKRPISLSICIPIFQCLFLLWVRYVLV